MIVENLQNDPKNTQDQKRFDPLKKYLEAKLCQKIDQHGYFLSKNDPKIPFFEIFWKFLRTFLSTPKKYQNHNFNP